MNESEKQEEMDKKVRNVKLTRMAKGLGLLISAIGRGITKFGDGIVRACDRSLAKPENREILKKMGKLPKNGDKNVVDKPKESEDSPDKSIVINIQK